MGVDRVPPRHDLAGVHEEVDLVECAEEPPGLAVDLQVPVAREDVAYVVDHQKVIELGGAATRRRQRKAGIRGR